MQATVGGRHAVGPEVAVMKVAVGRRRASKRPRQMIVIWVAGRLPSCRWPSGGLWMAVMQLADKCCQVKACLTLDRRKDM
jgi:hypothetical protein